MFCCRKMSSPWHNNDIQLFQEYLRINTAQPDVNYDTCVKFLERQAKLLGLPIKIYYPGHPEKPVVVITWTGTNPNLPSIVLNSHMDVVPADEQYWSHPPFAAEIDTEGRIFGRGTQDMKSVAIQYLIAIRALLQKGTRLKRTVHMMFVPDEELGGKLGMQKFILTDDFKTMNVGFSLDEGNASPTDVNSVFYGERAIWRAQFTITGTAGHGSLLLENTASEKLYRIMTEFLKFRNKELERLNSNPEMTIGDVTTVNLTVLQGGIATNVVPPAIVAIFDIRVAIDLPFDQLEKELCNWAEKGGEGIDLTYLDKEPKIQPTSIDDSNIYWVALRSGFVDDLKQKYGTFIRPGATDSRHMRGIGIPSIGFSPMLNTPILLHANDEFVGAQTFLDGIEVYKVLIPRLGNA